MPVKYPHTSLLPRIPYHFSPTATPLRNKARRCGASTLAWDQGPLKILPPPCAAGHGENEKRTIVHRSRLPRVAGRRKTGLGCSSQGSPETGQPWALFRNSVGVERPENTLSQRNLLGNIHQKNKKHRLTNQWWQRVRCLLRGCADLLYPLYSRHGAACRRPKTGERTIRRRSEGFGGLFAAWIYRRASGA